jgi:hypothetical protein
MTNGVDGESIQLLCIENPFFFMNAKMRFFCESATRTAICCATPIYKVVDHFYTMVHIPYLLR